MHVEPEAAVIQSQINRRRVVAGYVVELRAAGFAVERRRVAHRRILQFDVERYRRRDIQYRHVVSVDRVVVADHSQVIGLTRHGRDATPFVVGSVVHAEAGDHVARGVQHLDVQVAVGRQARPTAGKRSDLGEVDLQIERAGDLRDEPIPVLIAGDVLTVRERIEDRARIDVRAQIDRLGRAEVGGDQTVIVVLERVGVEDGQTRPGRGVLVDRHAVFVQELDPLDVAEDDQKRLRIGGADFDRSVRSDEALAIERQIVGAVIDHDQAVTSSRRGAAVDRHPQRRSDLVEQGVGRPDADQVRPGSRLDADFLDGADDQRLVLCHAVQAVGERVVGGLEDVDQVGCRGPFDQDRVEARATVVSIVAAATDEGVVPVATEEQVVAGAADQQVIAGATDQCPVGDQMVVASNAEKRDQDRLFDAEYGMDEVIPFVAQHGQAVAIGRDRVGQVDVVTQAGHVDQVGEPSTSRIGTRGNQ